MHGLMKLAYEFARPHAGAGMDDQLEKQLKRIEKTVAEILDGVKSLLGAHSTADKINARLRRFLERKK